MQGSAPVHVAANKVRAVVELLYRTGCRTGELPATRIEGIDFSERRIRVTAKAGARMVTFTATAEWACVCRAEDSSMTGSNVQTKS
jgi:site-specific recombinase XerD